MPNVAEILRSGPKAFNAWREKYPSKIPDLAGIALTLSERQMGSMNGGPINLTCARLNDATLRFATMSGANLEAADLSGADLVHARLNQANLTAAVLSGALLDHADFTGATLAKASLCDARLLFANLSGADLEGADLSGADAVHAQFSQANLSSANLSNAVLDHANFAGANFAEANLCGANLYHAKHVTQSQLEAGFGNASTILPPGLQAPVSWSVTGRATESSGEQHVIGPKTRHAVDVGTRRPGPAVIVGVLLVGGALIVAGLVQQLVTPGVSLDEPRTQVMSQPSFAEERKAKEIRAAEKAGKAKAVRVEVEQQQAAELRRAEEASKAEAARVEVEQQQAAELRRAEEASNAEAARVKAEQQQAAELRRADDTMKAEAARGKAEQPPVQKITSAEEASKADAGSPRLGSQPITGTQPPKVQPAKPSRKTSNPAIRKPVRTAKRTQSEPSPFPFAHPTCPLTPECAANRAWCGCDRWPRF